MYGIYGNIYHQYTPNDSMLASIYHSHGSYGYREKGKNVKQWYTNPSGPRPGFSRKQPIRAKKGGRSPMAVATACLSNENS